MKKVFFTGMFFILTINFASAQKMLNKNSYSLGGGISVSYSENDHPAYDSKTTSFIFNPSINYHLFDAFAIGGNLHFKYEDEAINGSSGNQHSVERIFEFGPTFRYYFHTENFAPFIDCSVSYSIVLPNKTKGYGFTFGTGINYFFTKSIAVEPKFSIAENKFSNPNYDSTIYCFGIALNYHINE